MRPLQTFAAPQTRPISERLELNERYRTIVRRRISRLKYDMAALPTLNSKPTARAMFWAHPSAMFDGCRRSGRYRIRNGAITGHRYRRHAVLARFATEWSNRGANPRIWAIHFCEMQTRDGTNAPCDFREERSLGMSAPGESDPRYSRTKS